MGTEIQGVTWEAEHVTEIHRTLENDHTVTEVELPGVVNLYAVFDGGRVLMDQIKAPVVLESIERAKQNQAASDAAQAQSAQTQTAQGSQDQGSQGSQDPQSQG